MWSRTIADEIVRSFVQNSVCSQVNWIFGVFYLYANCLKSSYISNEYNERFEFCVTFPKFFSNEIGWIHQMTSKATNKHNNNTSVHWLVASDHWSGPWNQIIIFIYYPKCHRCDRQWTQFLFPVQFYCMLNYFFFFFISKLLLFVKVAAVRVSMMALK